MSINKLKYDEALSQLKEISTQLENKQVSMDDLTSVVKKANELAEYCKTKLKSTETEIRKILDTSE